MISPRLPVPHEAPRGKKSSRGISMEQPAVDNPEKMMIVKTGTLPKS